MTPEEEIQRGNSALLVLNNPIYKEAMIALRGEIYEKFTKSSFKDRDLRDELHRQSNTLDFMENYIKKVMVSGKLGKSSLLERARLRKIK